MSYSLFNRELIQRNKEREKAGLNTLTMDEANELIIDHWWKQKKYNEIINYVLENWDAGNSDVVALPILEKFIEQRECTLFVRFWKGILRQRIENVWSFKGYKPTIELLEYLENLDLSGFNPYHSTEPPDRQLAHHRKFALEGITTYMEGLKKLGLQQEQTKAALLYEQVYKLARPIPKPATDKRKIDENIFWLLIDESRAGTTNSGDFIENLRNKLEHFPEKELKNFDKWFIRCVNDLNSWDQWALAYIVRGGCGDDEFDYYRAWVVSLGRKAFETVKSMDESRLTSLFTEDPQLEQLYYLAADLYELRTGDIYTPPLVKPNKITGSKWTEEQLEQTYHSLFQLFR